MDRMRESVFAVLGNLGNLSFLDIFSGTGIIALEAASRGARPVEAVEMDTGKRGVLLENVSISPCAIRCRFMPAELYIKRAKVSFDCIFCDPPFPYRYKWELARDIAASPLMKEGSRLVIHRPREDPPGAIPLLVPQDHREYGRSTVDFFVCQKKRGEPGQR
jgi:16S rRNA (guanine(966)-N(2))-methyltransferase RsmD